MNEISDSSELTYGVKENSQQLLSIFRCDPLAWLSELYKEREYIKSNIQVLRDFVT